MWKMVVAKMVSEGFPQERKCVMRQGKAGAEGSKGTKLGEGKKPGHGESQEQMFTP